MRLMVCTFSDGDAEKTLRAMRLLSYDRLVLVGEPGTDSSDDFSTVSVRCWKFVATIFVMPS